MSVRKKTRPTDGELEILRILWERGESTVREVHEVLDARHPTGYTTVLKLLQIMTEKGLVRRDASERAHVYQARIPREDTERQLVGDLLEADVARGSRPHPQAPGRDRGRPEMTELATVLGSPLFQRIGWALLAFFWQGTLVAALVACAGVALPRRKAALRYAVGCGALLLMLAMPVATFLTHPLQPRDAPGASDLRVASGPAAEPASRVSSLPSGLPQPSAGGLGQTLRRSAGSVTPFLVAGWLLGVLLLSLRFLAGWTAARSLVRHEVSPASEALLATLSRLCERLRVS